MTYLKVSAVKKLFHRYDKQVTKDGLYAIDKKVADFIVRCANQFNGHHSRITSDIVSLIKL